MNNFKKPGDTMTFTAPSGGVVSGTAYLIGAVLAVATNTVAENLPFEGMVEGVFTLPKATGSAWTEGELLYWDDTAKKLTTVSTSNTLVGVAAAAATSGATSGDARLDAMGLPVSAPVDAGVQDIVLGTDAPDGDSEFLFVSTTGTKTGAVPNGSFTGQKLQVIQYVAATSPVGTLTGLFKNQAGTAKTTLALGTATGFIGLFVWDGAAYRQVSDLGGTGSGLS